MLELPEKEEPKPEGSELMPTYLVRLLLAFLRSSLILSVELSSSTISLARFLTARRSVQQRSVVPLMPWSFPFSSMQWKFRSALTSDRFDLAKSTTFSDPFLTRYSRRVSP